MTSTSTGSPNGARQVAHEHEGALEHPYEQRRAIVVLRRELVAQLGHPFLQDILGYHDLTQVRVVAPSVDGHRCAGVPMARPSVIGRRHYRTPPVRSALKTVTPASAAPASPGRRRWHP